MSTDVVAIDGPAGSGKSTVARALAAALNWSFLDTGAMYRAVTSEVLYRGVDPEDVDAVAQVARAVVIATEPRVLVDGRDVGDQLRDAAVNQAVSAVASNPAVRAAMVERQRAWVAAQPGGAVVEGRDIATVVFPSASLKVFLTASLGERARRRGDEGLSSIARRDDADRERAASPLRRARDAIEIDTTDRSIDDVVKEIITCLKTPI